jgi:hypothetical protein
MVSPVRPLIVNVIGVMDAFNALVMTRNLPLPDRRPER